MSDEPGNPPRPPRRKRYAGTHPRRFDQRYKELSPEKYPELVEHVRQAGRTPAGTHVPIMVAEVMQALAPAPGDVAADCTLGYGGHAQEFLKRMLPGGRVIGFDVDAEQLERTAQRLEGFGEAFKAVRGNFAGLGKALAAEGLDGFDVIFADLGVSSMQVDDPRRGFSYKHEGPLDMRMDARLARSAADLAASLSREELSQALRELGDEEDHQAIAAEIVRVRRERPIRTTGELVDAVFRAKKLNRRRWREQTEEGLHPAARTFQAMRILVNDELGSLRQLLRLAPYCLRAGGRIGILSFHSGEDRLVKQAFREGLRNGDYAQAADEVVRPTAQEVHSNPRSSSAKLRWARK